MNRVTKVLLTASCLAAAAQAQANWPTELASNTTGFADSVFLGPPDGNFVGLGWGQVTFDFGDMVIVNRQFSDFNVYKWNNGSGVALEGIVVLVSQNGIDFFEAGPQQGITERISGDGVTFVTRINGRDLGSLEWARYVRIQGTSNLPPGGTNGYDFDALGAFELMPAPPIPEPTTWALMLAGLAWLARRRQVAP